MLVGPNWSKPQFGQSILFPALRYANCMKNKSNHERIPPELDRYLVLCERIYERMVETGECAAADRMGSGRRIAVP